MAVLSFRTVPPSHFLADNPVMFELFSDTQAHQIEFDIEADGAPAYSGVFLPSGSAPAYEANLSVQDILQSFFADPPAPVSPDAVVSELARMYIDFIVRFRQEDALLTHAARAYRGGVSKEMLRYLKDEGQDIFSYRLLNTQRQFFMTTRTLGSRIVLRESELAPLCFIATGKTHRVTTDTGETYLFPPTEPGKVYAFNIEAFVNSLAPRPRKLFLPLFMGYSITVDLHEPALVPNRFVLEFTNSYGVPERLEITGRSAYAPETQDASYSVYDFTVDDYVERNERQQMREILTCASGYKTRDELLFLREALQSDRCYLLERTSGLRREVRVKAENGSHAVWPVAPGSVTLTVRSVDGDTQFTPERSADDSIGEQLFMATLNVQANRLLNSLPFTGNVNVTVDWGDGTEETLTADYPQHTYSAPGEYAIVVLGHTDMMHTNPGLQNQNIHQVNWMNNLAAIERWGDLGCLSLEQACYGCVNLSQTERHAKFDHVTSVSAMFRGCSSLRYTFTQLHAPLLTEAYSMYQECTSLEEIPEGLFAGCLNLQNISNLFLDCTSLVNVPVSLFAGNIKLQDASQVFYRCRRLKNTPSFYYNRDIKSFRGAFSTCAALTDIPDFCFFHSASTDMSGLFSNCSSLTNIPEHIFSGAAEVLNFASVFSGSAITSLHKDLFRDCVKVTSFSSAFSSCKSLTAVPDDLFRFNTEVLSFNYLFSSSSVSSVPADLFRYNTKVLSFQYMFYSAGSIQSVPSGLFQYNTEAYMFDSLFYESGLTVIPESLFANIKNDGATSLTYCFYRSKITSIPASLFSSLTQIQSMNSVFAWTPVESIPAALFSHNVNLTNLKDIFNHCSALKDIPANLFQYNIHLKNLDGIFAYTGITSIPSGLLSTLAALETCPTTFAGMPVTAIPESLFSNCPALRDVSWTFSYMAITSIPNMLFDSNKEITNFYECFLNSYQLTGLTPSGSDGLKLWERAGQPGYPASINGTRCFYACRQLDEYGDIPSGWR
jgi:hypothetical protein